MTKLLVITNSMYAFRGGEKWTLELAERLPSGYEIVIASVYCPEEPVRMTMEQIMKEYKSGNKIVDLEASGTIASAFGKEGYYIKSLALQEVRLLFDLIKQTDIVYSVSMNPFVLAYAVMFSNTLGKKFILGVHNPLFSKIFERTTLSTLGMRTLLRKVKRFHVLNSDDFRLVRAHFPKAEVSIVPIFATKQPSIFKNNRKQFIVLYVGVLNEQKGADFLCEIIRKTIALQKRIVFHIIGSGGEGVPLVQALAEEFPSNVKYLGFVGIETLEKEYLGASLSVVTSRYEGLPQAILEMQSYGLPVVGFNVRGVRDLLNQSIRGDMVDAFDTDAFALKIVSFYTYWKRNNKKYLRRKVDIGRSIKEEYAPDKIIGEIDKMINL